MAHPDCPFTPRTFELLALLHDQPCYSVYLAHQAEFKTLVETPFQRVMRQVARRLPSSVTERIETEKKLFSRFPKNDFGHGGAWDFYWGAFYTRGGKRTVDAQLSVWMNYKRFEIGFYIGSYGTTARARFQHNCRRLSDQLMQLFDPLLVEGSILLGTRDTFDLDANGSVIIKEPITLREWLRNPSEADYDASLIFLKDQVLKLSEDQLVQHIAQTFLKLFPLVILATSDDPLPAIAEYLNDDGGDDWDIYPAYPLPALAAETGLPEEELAAWLQALERKKQAIFYGPPGTGKTFLARHLARHLVGGSDGILDLVQFHPAYTYANFVEASPAGLPPGLPGRFVQFCSHARLRRGPCVFIIDEINRANSPAHREACGLSAVFGELLYLLEHRDEEITLASGRTFSIPANVRILATLNTAHPAAALGDYGLRRRFAFLPLPPNYDLLIRYHQAYATGFPAAALAALLQQINTAIADPNYALGPASFLIPDLAAHLPAIWTLEIEPYLAELFAADPTRLTPFRWEKIAHLF